MRRISLLAVLALASAGGLLAQPTITSIQTDSTGGGSPTNGAAITSATPLSNGLFVYVNGTFDPLAEYSLNWTNTVTGVTQSFAGSVNGTYTQVMFNVPPTGSAGSFYGNPVYSPQLVNLSVSEVGSLGSFTSNTLPFTVNPVMGVVGDYPAGTVGVPYSTPAYSSAYGGTPPYTVSKFVDPPVPSSLGLNYSTGPQNVPTFSGTPLSSGIFEVGPTVSDAWGNQIFLDEFILITNPATVTSVTPNSAIAGANTQPVTITVTGTNFLPPDGDPQYAGTSLAIQNTIPSSGLTPLTTTYVDGNTLTAPLPPSLLAQSGTYNIYAVQPSGVASVTGVPFTVLGPTITAVSPPSITARATPITLMVTGTNYVASGFSTPSQSTILLNGTAVATSFLSTTSLSTTATFSTPNTSVAVQVENPSGESVSNIVNVPILPAPTITSVTPNPFNGGTLRVNGTNFTNTMAILFNGNPVTTIFVNNTQLNATIPPTLLSGTSALVTVVTIDNYTTPPYRIQFGSGPQVTTPNLPTGNQLQPYDAKLAATGGTPPYTWSISGLPRNLVYSTTTGEITGTPTGFGTFPITITITDYNGLTGSAVLSLTINQQAPAPTVNPATLPNAFVNVSYNFTFSASGGSGNLSFSSNNPPPGLTLSFDGTLRGLPTTAGTFSFSVSVSDSNGLSTSTGFTLVVKPQPLAIINSSPLAAVAVGSTVNITFTAFGGVQPYSFTSGGTLPPGTSLSAAGVLSGTATTAGTYSFTVTVSDNAGDAPSTKSFSITVNPAALTATGTFANGQVGVAYTAQYGATGGISPYTVTVSGLPPGVTASNGTASGTPTTAGQFTVTVSVTDSQRTTATQNFTVTIAPAALTITTTSLPNATSGVLYSATLAASGGTGKYTWSVTGLPSGLSADATGAISGTPGGPGTFSVTATVTDAGVTTAVISVSKSFTLTVAAQALVISTASLPNGTVGTAYKVTLNAGGGVPGYTWSATGLPAGLSISADGTISGTPTGPGTSTVTVTVKDSQSTPATTSQTFQLVVVLPAAPPVTFTGLPANSAPATQSTLQITISNPYPVPITVNLTLTFAADSGPDDPTVQFASGGRTAQLSIPAGATVSLSSIGVQTGTVAGTVTITAQLLAGTQNITPTPPPSRTIRINTVPPSITSVAAASSSGGFTVTVIGFATSRAITQAVFTFTPAAGVNLQPTTVTVPLTSLFATWFSSSAAAQFGGQFTYTQPFTVAGGSASVTSVSVVLVNADGSSTAASATVH